MRSDTVYEIIRLGAVHTDIEDAKRDVQRLEALLEVSRLVSMGVRGQELHEIVVATIAQAFEFETVVLNLARPAHSDFEVVVVQGSEDARKALAGTTSSAESWEPLLDPRFNIEGAYFVPAGAFDWTIHTEPSFVPELRPLDHHDAWRPDDALFVALRHSDGHLLGVLSLDQPSSGLRPSAGDLAVLAGVAANLAQAVESAAAADATERLVDELRDAERRNRALIEWLPGIVYRAPLADDNPWLYVSPQIERVLGFTPQEWLADAELWLRQMHPEDRERALADEDRTRATGVPLLSEYRLLAKDGRIVWIHDEAVVLEEAHGPVLQGVMYDVTDRKTAEPSGPGATERGAA
ncbi:MAG TPA: PAS domain-containing protein [Solirubrobacteraceae bacterium]|nr:PAS domain-containing protein [Solirubrobacteraceae bacterium]